MNCYIKIYMLLVRTWMIAFAPAVIHPNRSWREDEFELWEVIKVHLQILKTAACFLHGTAILIPSAPLLPLRYLGGHWENRFIGANNDHMVVSLVAMVTVDAWHSDHERVSVIAHAQPVLNSMFRSDLELKPAFCLFHCQWCEVIVVL